MEKEDGEERGKKKKGEGVEYGARETERAGEEEETGGEEGRRKE